MSGPLGEHTGGAYVHISRTWDSLYLGYIVMWIKWISFIGIISSLATQFGNTMRVFEFFMFFSGQQWAVFWITIFFVLNLVGIDIFANIQTVLTAVLVGILLLLVIPGLFFVEIDNFVPLFPDQAYADGFFGSLISGTASLLFAFIGFETLAQTGEETQAPQETLPKIFGYTTVVVGLLYVLVTFVVIGTIGWQTAVAVTKPLTTAAQTYFPAATAVIITFGSMVAFATTINASYLVPSRLMYAYGMDKISPVSLRHVNERFQTPDVGLVITYVLSVGFVLTASFDFLLTISLAAIFLLYLAHSLSGLALPWRHPELYEQSAFQPSRTVLMAITGVSAAGMAVFAWYTLGISTLGPAIATMLQGNIIGGLTSSPVLIIISWAIVGTVIFYGYRGYRRMQDEEIAEEQTLQRLYESPNKQFRNIIYPFAISNLDKYLNSSEATPLFPDEVPQSGSISIGLISRLGILPCAARQWTNYPRDVLTKSNGVPLSFSRACS
jgi:APA family basic amino acid/polyamine antiporter